MIQRIQTVYLLIASLLLGFMVQQPIASFIIDDKVYNLMSYKFVAEADAKDVIFYNYPLMVLIVVASILAFVTIFFFKKRRLQMRLTIFNILITIGIYPMIYYYYLQASAIKKLEFVFNYPVLFPLFAIIFLLLAFMGIRRDELVIQSLNRIR
jgi:hypothetical protein